MRARRCPIGHVEFIWYCSCKFSRSRFSTNNDGLYPFTAQKCNRRFGARPTNAARIRQGIKRLNYLTRKLYNMSDLEVKEKKKSKDKSGDGSSSAKVEKKEKKEKDSSKTEGGEKAEKKEKKEKKDKDPDAAAAPKEKSDKSDREKEKKDKSDKSERSVKSDKSEKPSKDKKSSRDDSVADTGRPGAPPPPTARAPPVKSTLPVKKTNYLAGLDLPSEGACEFRQPLSTVTCMEKQSSCRGDEIKFVSLHVIAARLHQCLGLTKFILQVNPHTLIIMLAQRQRQGSSQVNKHNPVPACYQF